MADKNRIFRTSKKGRFTFISEISSTPMTEAEYEHAESLLAKMIARAYAADHPELFQPQNTPDRDPGEGESDDR